MLEIKPNILSFIFTVFLELGLCHLPDYLGRFVYLSRLSGIMNQLRISAGFIQPGTNLYTEIAQPEMLIAENEGYSPLPMRNLIRLT